MSTDRSHRSRGRMPPQRRERFDELYAIYGLAGTAAVPAWAPEVLDIGFGAGESLVAAARSRPDARVLGVEVYLPTMLRAMRGLEQVPWAQVRVVRADVTAVLPLLAAGSLSLAQVFYPDPWPKRRHAARRLLCAPVLERVSWLLAPGGILHLATDAGDYASAVARAVGRQCRLVPLAESETPPAPATRYAARAAEAGRGVHNLAWARESVPAVTPASRWPPTGHSPSARSAIDGRIPSWPGSQTAAS